MIGAAEAAANLLCEFKIAEKKDARQINIKNGKVILVKEVASSIFLYPLQTQEQSNLQKLA